MCFNVLSDHFKFPPPPLQLSYATAVASSRPYDGRGHKHERELGGTLTKHWSVPAALWIKDAMRSHWEIRPRLCGFTTAFYASLRWESSPSFAALASRLAQTECFCVPVGWSQSAVRGTLPGNLWFQPNAVSVVVPVWQQLSSSSYCGLNTSACPVLSAHWIRRESELTWWEKPF